MNMLALMLPWFLLTHNVIDFYDNGAGESYVECLNHVVTTYIENLEKYNPIRFTNKTGCMDDEGIHKIGLQFDAAVHVELAEARLMMLGLIDSFLQALNDFPGPRPYLKCGEPFTSCQLEIRVQFTDDCKFPYPSPNEIKYMIFKDGKISFYLGNPRCLGKLTRLRDEPLCLSRRINASLGPSTIDICGGRFLPPK